VIYGAGGSIGGAVARAFARDGATLFLTGHVRASVEAIAKDIVSAGGSAEAAEVDALVERSIDSHLTSVMDKAGRVDISFNAVGIPDADILGVPLVDLDLEQFSQPRWVAWTTSTRRGPPTGIRIDPGCGIGS
jgi:NAD(P)-dependent dehydrogenase (short-subunit alcohol dehydrogenase family)